MPRIRPRSRIFSTSPLLPIPAVFQEKRGMLMFLSARGRGQRSPSALEKGRAAAAGDEANEAARVDAKPEGGDDDQGVQEHVARRNQATHDRFSSRRSSASRSSSLRRRKRAARRQRLPGRSRGQPQGPRRAQQLGTQAGGGISGRWPRDSRARIESATQGGRGISLRPAATAAVQLRRL